MGTSEPVGVSDTSRLTAVRRYMALQSGSDPALDRVCAMAARTFKVPMAAVAFVDAQRVWYKGRFGFELDSTPAEPGLCATAVMRAGSYVLIDARADPRAATHPLVKGSPGIRFFAATPIVVEDGQHIGTLAVMDTQPRRVPLDQLATLRDLAIMVADKLEVRRAAVDVITIEQEARSRIQAEAARVGQIAETLQGTLTPAQLPSVPGLDVAAFYQPLPGEEVGGDFYDVFPIDNHGRWGVFVGDVVGKGVGAAAFTSLVRYSLRTAAVVEPGPAEVLRAVNEAVMLDPASDEALYCTVAYGELAGGEGGTWHARLAVGGHPPPLIIRGGESVEVVEAAGTLVGTFANQRYPAASVELRPGDTMLFYSDGMTDLPTSEGWLGVEGIMQILEHHPVGSASEALDLLRSAIAANDRALRDDLVAVAVSVPEPAGRASRPGGADDA